VRTTFTLSDRALSYWDVDSSGWKVADGCYTVEAGAHSRDLPLKLTFSRSNTAMVVESCS